MLSRVPPLAPLAGGRARRRSHRSRPGGRSRRHRIKEEFPMTANMIPDLPDWALRELLRAEREQIDIFKWNLGVQLGHDPLLDRSMTEIAEEWITKHVVAFRAWWDEQIFPRLLAQNGS
jgi:hypothetical protein